MPAQDIDKIDEEKIYFHVYNKGIEGKILFNDNEDYSVFLGFLNDYLTAPASPESVKKDFVVNGRSFRGTPHLPKNYLNKIELIAYRLKPDSFHLVLSQKTQSSLERFIRSLSVRYSIYFNKKYQRTGSIFQGPYKSVQITENSRLLLLTYFLHHSNNLSSYAEYIGKRTTLWVKPKVVQSYFNTVKSDLFKETDSYKDFVEKYTLNQDDLKLLEGITFEKVKPPLVRYLERRDLESNKKELPELNSRPILNISQFLGLSSIILLVLLTFGIRNVQAFNVKKLKSSLTFAESNSVVKGIQYSPTPIASITTPINTDPKTIVTIKTNHDTPIGIYQKPNFSAEIIDKADNGDTFELSSKNSGWYEIKLAAGSTGFIPAEFIEKEEIIN